MYRKAFDRANASDKSSTVRGGRGTAIPRNDGRPEFLEAVILLLAMVVLAIALGFAIGLPLMLMLNDMCTKLNC